MNKKVLRETNRGLNRKKIDWRKKEDRRSDGKEERKIGEIRKVRKVRGGKKKE